MVSVAVTCRAVGVMLPDADVHPVLKGMLTLVTIPGMM